MSTQNSKYLVFLLLVIVFTIPFYLWGLLFPVEGLPFGLPISFLAILVPGALALIYAWKDQGAQGAASMLRSVFDAGRASRSALAFCLLCMPAVAVLSYGAMAAFSFPLPAQTVIPYGEIPVMLVLYFLGAIPEELGWTYTLSAPLSQKYGVIPAGVLIGGVWALWHIIPWSENHTAGWIAGMCLLDILMRIAMLHVYVYGGKSLFTGIVFHMMINVSMGLFPNSGSHADPWIFSAWMAVLLGLLMYRSGPAGKRKLQAG
ncbi:type II CAAX prenyl endopeptidase Rce1 family protein [Paenibacillus sp. S150]|uniref:CPBP family glutamic-type intramembrane protease n=1 Tax=Paenibacillus sp. S150 TaxID=2749826 RepID=UPI001C5786AE|nr:CPBP family glutamic-type intramembrane protease [Paenibacillus sp. S150]MBW4082488.1 CPBP family intramembrane metalloprotease [Paenibacillus sp. S150]